MFTPPPAALRRRLARLRARGEPLGVSELAQQLLALRTPLEPSLARRVVAVALGQPETALRDPLEPCQLRPAEEAAVAGVRLEQADFAVVDLETTGLSVERASILEIGAVRVSRLECVARFATLVRPPRAVPRRIADLTGIDAAALADAPAPGRALRAFHGWLAQASAAPFVAHNAPFDARFLGRAFADQRLAPHRGPLLCTRRLARRTLPELGRYDLDHVCAHFGIANRARHRALGDAEATARVLIELLQCARGGSAVQTLGDLLDLQERPPPKRRAGRRRAGG